VIAAHRAGFVAGWAVWRDGEADLIRNIHGIAEVAGLNGDEVGFLLGRIAEIKSLK
jgi:hypothetical protein